MVDLVIGGGAGSILGSTSLSAGVTIGSAPLAGAPGSVATVGVGLGLPGTSSTSGASDGVGLGVSVGLTSPVDPSPAPVAVVDTGLDLSGASSASGGSSGVGVGVSVGLTPPVDTSLLPVTTVDVGVGASGASSPTGGSDGGVGVGVGVGVGTGGGLLGSGGTDGGGTGTGGTGTGTGGTGTGGTGTGTGGAGTGGTGTGSGGTGTGGAGGDGTGGTGGSGGSSGTGGTMDGGGAGSGTGMGAGSGAGSGSGSSGGATGGGATDGAGVSTGSGLPDTHTAFVNIFRLAGTADISAADNARLATLDQQVSSGAITQTQAILQIGDWADGATAVAETTYQFFSGLTPSADGLSYLVHSPNNTTDLSDAYYSNFDLENRYINFASNLGLHSDYAPQFAQDFGSLTFQQAVATAYDRIVGDTNAQAAGIDYQAAIADIVSRQPYFQEVAQERFGTDNQDLATKLAAVAYIMEESVRADVGRYGQANQNFLFDLADGKAQFHVDLVGVYGHGAPTNLTS